MKNKITISKPNNTFGSVRKEIEISFPAHRMTVDEAKQFAANLSAAIKEVENL